MANTDDPITEFMNQKNKENLGEEVEKQDIEDDNFLSEKQKAMNTFDGEMASKDDKGMLMLRRIINTIIIGLLFSMSLFTILYIILKIGPSFLAFIRKLMLGLLV